MTNDIYSSRVHSDFPSDNRFLYDEKKKKPIKKDPNFLKAIDGFIKTEDEKKKKRIERSRILARYNVER